MDAQSQLNPDQIKELRLRLKMTQDQFADEIGVHTMTVSRWERGQSTARGLALRELHRLIAKTQ